MSTLSPLSIERRTDHWTSDDQAEQYVRQLLVESRRDFENHSLDAETERGEFLSHRKAIIIPLGAHFDAIGTDVDFTREVYTCRFLSPLLHP